jgi:hypothetical protein
MGELISKHPAGRLKKWEANIHMDFRETGCEKRR